MGFQTEISESPTRTDNLIKISTHSKVESIYPLKGMKGNVEMSTQRSIYIRNINSLKQNCPSLKLERCDQNSEACSERTSFSSPPVQWAPNLQSCSSVSKCSHFQWETVSWDSSSRSKRKARLCWGCGSLPGMAGQCQGAPWAHWPACDQDSQAALTAWDPAPSWGIHPLCKCLFSLEGGSSV